MNAIYSIVKMLFLAVVVGDFIDVYAAGGGLDGPSSVRYLLIRDFSLRGLIEF